MIIKPGLDGPLQPAMKCLTTMLCAAAITAFPILAPAATADDQTYAPTALTAVQILQRAQAAKGTREPGSYKIVETSHGGGMAATTTTLVNHDNLISSEVRGPFTTAWGSYDGQDWSQDANGIVTLDSDYHVAENPDDRALAHPEDPANRVTVLGITQNADPAYAVDVDPPDGEHEIRYYDKATFHLVRVVRWGSDRRQHVVTYRDYRTAFGSTRAYRSDYSDGRADNDSDNTVVSIERLPALPNLRIPQSRSLFTFPSLAPVVLPADIDDTRVFVRLDINGRGLDFLLDSGASGIFIDPGVARQLDLKTYGKNTETMGGNVDISQTIVPLVTIGSIQMHNVVFHTAPITGELGEGIRAVGLMGYDFLASATIGVDFKDDTVTAYPPGVVPTHEVVSKIPVQLDDGVPRVPATLDGVPGHFLLDLGAFRSILYPSYVEKLPSARNVMHNVGASFVGGTETMSQYVVRDIIFGGVKFGSGTFMVPQNSLADLHEYDGIIGRDVLSGYALYFDYAHQAIYVRYQQ
jgi:hypothetical protein